MYLTIDGNHHANRYVKNSDLRDESLLLGRSYFPDKDSYREYLAKTTVTKEVSLMTAYSCDTSLTRNQKSQCSWISAVNMQDRKKFRGNDETGLINVQCRHVYILVSVDMYLGER